MTRIIVIAIFLSTIFAKTACRQGWKTYGNGYFVYETKTDFQKTNKLRIDGIFSVMPNATSKRTLLSVYDANEKFAFQLMMYRDIFYTAYSIEGIVEEKTWNAPGISGGYAYPITVTVTKNQSVAGLQHTVKTDILPLSGTGFTVAMPNVTFNFSRIKIKIGGNSLPDPVGSQFFEGCLSSFTFQGTDIISTYFRQYPNNTNPVRGRETFIRNGHRFSNVSESCDDVMTTTGPTETIVPITTAPSSPTTQPSTKESNLTTSITPTTSHGGRNQIFFGTLFFGALLSCIAKVVV